MKSTRLAFENFDGPFITHGIDVIEDPEQANAVYIYAVNHLPNPASSEASKSENIPKARSQIELFHHILKSDSVRHVRSIYHPLIKTPNDIFAASPVSFYVTNDHFYREGTMRHIEDFWPAAGWSDIIHVQIDNLASKDAPIEASVALTGLRNNNGLGHGRTKKEMAIVSPIGGKLYIASLHESDPSISVGTTVSFDTLIDNPTYYTDPYRTEADDASGFVIAGVSQAFKVPANSIDPNATDPSQVWYTRLNPGSGVWEKRLLFEDDGSRIRSASAAVLIPIDPKGGKKLAWLFITGFLSESILVVQVEL